MTVMMKRRTIVATAVGAVLGGVLVAPTPVAALGAQPAFVPQVPGIAINADGRMELFGVDTRGRLQHNWEHFAGSGANENGFHGWDGIGGESAVFAPVVALRRTDGRLQAYARGRDHSLWEVHQTNFGIWSGWRSLGGRIVGAPTATTAPDGRIVVYGRGADNRVISYTAHTPSSDWYTVQRLEGGLINHDPVAITRPRGQVEVYARGYDNGLYRFTHHPGSANPVWEYDINSVRMVSRPGIGFDGPYARVFMADAHTMFVSRQFTLGPDAGWATDYGRGYGAVGDPAVTQDSGQVRVYMRFTDNVIRQYDGHGWSGQIGPVDIRFGGSPAAFTTGNVQHVTAVDVEGRIRYTRRGGDNVFKPWRLV